MMIKIISKSIFTKNQLFKVYTYNIDRKVHNKYIQKTKFRYFNVGMKYKDDPNDLKIKLF